MKIAVAICRALDPMVIRRKWCIAISNRRTS